MNKNDNLGKMNHILSDTSKFRKVGNEYIYKFNLNLEDKIDYQLRNMKSNEILNEHECSSLYVTGMVPYHRSCMDFQKSKRKAYP